MSAVKLAPSILSADFARMADAAAAVERAGADWLHVDVMDGHFVPNLTFGPKMVEDLRRATALPLDVHLMIDRPERWIDRFCRAGADVVTVHVEATRDAVEVLESIRRRGKRSGITLRPNTALAALEAALPHADLVLVMSVEPGFGGQEFIEGSDARVAELASRLRQLGLTPEIEVDGGVKPEHCGPLARAGATVLVAGSGVYLDPEGVESAVAKYRRSIVSL